MAQCSGGTPGYPTPRQPANERPSNSSRHPAARSAAVSVLGAPAAGDALKLCVAELHPTASSATATSDVIRAGVDTSRISAREGGVVLLDVGGRRGPVEDQHFVPEGDRLLRSDLVLGRLTLAVGHRLLAERVGGEQSVAARM